MAAIDDLIKQIQDVDLRDQIQKEVDKLSKQKKFGLVFEEHLPEYTPLYDVPIKKGCNVMLKNDKEDRSIYSVLDIKDDIATCLDHDHPDDPRMLAVSDIVRVAEFGEPIYPYLKSIDTVCNAPESNLWHTLIEADNYHALQLLEYLYAGKVDCIYIDPPYNTGAKDWKYNNDYVDGNDVYRHSKWLSMMEKRLKIAKKLLNPKNSVLIVTIDEKEYLHLGCLLEEMFPEARMQMITTRINKKGSTRTGQFARCDEYIFLLQLGDCNIQKNRFSMLDVTDNSNPNANSNPNPKRESSGGIWSSLLRRGAGGSSREESSPNMFYPIWVDEDKKKIELAGEPLPKDLDRHTIENNPPRIGLRAVWPIRTDGSEGRWQLGYETFKKYMEQGIVKLGAYNKKRDQWAVLFLKKKQKEQLADGIIISKGKAEDGSLILEYNTEEELDREPKTMWIRDWHDASTYGTNLLSKFLPKRNFPFPKSLYAVEDILRFYTKDKTDALIVDFFAGSGTTLHAVNLLNTEDQGHRRCILVTNNEVSDEEARSLTEQGFHPGDSEWEKYGIARYVTWPRIVCSIEGHDINGQPLKGNYLGSDIPMADGFKANVAFFRLGFLDKTSVALGMQFKEMLPTLWMKAGAIGPCPSIEEDIPDMLILPQNKFAVLNNEDFFALFENDLQQHPEIQTVFLVTDYDVNYRSMANSLNVKTTYQLYRDYLDNFRINQGRD